MQHNNPQANKAGSSGGAGGGGAKDGGAQKGPLVELEKAIQELETQSQQLQTEIAKQESDLKGSETELDQKRAEKKALDASKLALQRLVTEATNDAQKAGQGRKAGEAEAQSARLELDRIRQDLDERLSDEYRAEVDAAVATVDDEIERLKAEREQKWEASKAAGESLAQAKADAAEAEAALKTAQMGQRGLPGSIASWTAQVKKAVAALKSAFDKGQDREAYLLLGDLEIALAGLEERLDPAYEAGLLEKVQEAWKTSAEAGKAVGPAEAVQKTAQSELAAAEKAMKSWIDDRRQKITEQLESQPAPTPETA